MGRVENKIHPDQKKDSFSLREMKTALNLYTADNTRKEDPGLVGMAADRVSCRLIRKQRVPSFEF